MDFFKTQTGKKVEAGLWQMGAVALGIGIVAAGEFDIRWLLPFVPAMSALTKYININFIKN